MAPATTTALRIKKVKRADPLYFGNQEWLWIQCTYCRKAAFAKHPLRWDFQKTFSHPVRDCGEKTMGSDWTPYCSGLCGKMAPATHLRGNPSLERFCHFSFNLCYIFTPIVICCAKHNHKPIVFIFIVVVKEISTLSQVFSLHFCHNSGTKHVCPFLQAVDCTADPSSYFSGSIVEVIPC